MANVTFPPEVLRGSAAGAEPVPSRARLVLIVLEGRAAGEALGRKGAPVDAAVIGIVDSVAVHE